MLILLHGGGISIGKRRTQYSGFPPSETFEQLRGITAWGVFCPWRPRSLCALRLVFVHHSKRLCNGLPPTSIRKVHMRRDTSEGAIESASRHNGGRYVIQYTRVGIAK